MNANFGSPKSRLIDIIIDAVMAGELTAYDPTPSKDDPNGDSFKTILPINQVMARFGGDSVLVEKFDENGDVISSGYEARVFSGEDVLKFRIKEDWIFDKQRSVFEPRIVGIAPLITPRIPGLESAGFPNPSSGFSFNFVSLKEVNMVLIPVCVFSVDVLKLVAKFLNASSMESETFNATKPSNTKYKIPIIFCLGVSLCPAIF